MRGRRHSRKLQRIMGKHKDRHKNVVHIYSRKYGKTRQLCFCSNFFEDCEYYTIDIFVDWFVVKKHRLDTPKSSLKATKNNAAYQLNLYGTDLPIGTFKIDLEDSNEDELFINL